MHTAVVLALVVLATGCKKDDPCDNLVNDATECYDDICDSSSAGTAFCDCWDQGKDLDISTCTCAPLDLTAACDIIDVDEYEAGYFDCDLAEDALSNMCPEE